MRNWSDDRDKAANLVILPPEEADAMIDGKEIDVDGDNWVQHYLTMLLVCLKITQIPLMLLQTSSTHQVTLPKLMSLYLQVTKKKKITGIKISE